MRSIYLSSALAILLTASGFTLRGYHGAGSLPPATDGTKDASAGTVQLVIAGDVMLDGAPGAFLERGGNPFTEFATALKQADYAVANLECVISTLGERVPKRFNFRAHPRVLPLLAQYFAGFSLANNHTGDFGKEAFEEQLTHLDRAHIGYYGGGKDSAQAHTPLILERNGIRIALLGFDEIEPCSFEAGPSTPGVAWSLEQESQVVADLKAARAVFKADVVIPFMHWGFEDVTEPNERQWKMARLMIDAGADVVVGAHPHITQGVEYYKGRLIVYSLGNFVFDDYEDRTGWVLRLTLNKKGLVEWNTLIARTDAQGIPHRVQGSFSPCGRAGSEAIHLRRNE